MFVPFFFQLTLVMKVSHHPQLLFLQKSHAGLKNHRLSMRNWLKYLLLIQAWIVIVQHEKFENCSDNDAILLIGDQPDWGFGQPHSILVERMLLWVITSALHKYDLESIRVVLLNVHALLFPANSHNESLASSVSSSTKWMNLSNWQGQTLIWSSNMF